MQNLIKQHDLTLRIIRTHSVARVTADSVTSNGCSTPSSLMSLTCSKLLAQQSLLMASTAATHTRTSGPCLPCSSILQHRTQHACCQDGDLSALCELRTGWGTRAWGKT